MLLAPSSAEYRAKTVASRSLRSESLVYYPPYMRHIARRAYEEIMKYETLPPQNFLGLDDEHSAYATSAALILPIPYEGTVSYGRSSTGARAPAKARAPSSKPRTRLSCTTAS